MAQRRSMDRSPDTAFCTFRDEFHPEFRSYLNQRPANGESYSQPFSADAGCRRGLLRRLCSPCIGLRGRAVLSPCHDWTSGHKRHCPQWRRLSQPRGSPKRWAQSLQPDELGMGGNVQDMVCSRRSPKSCWLDGPIDQVKCSRKRWCASGCLFNANIEAEGHGGLDALVLVLSRQRSPTSLSRGKMADGDLVRSPPRPAMSLGPHPSTVPRRD